MPQSFYAVLWAPSECWGGNAHTFVRMHTHTCALTLIYSNTHAIHMPSSRTLICIPSHTHPYTNMLTKHTHISADTVAHMHMLPVHTHPHTHTHSHTHILRLTHLLTCTHIRVLTHTRLCFHHHLLPGGVFVPKLLLPRGGGGAVAERQTDSH